MHETAEEMAEVVLRAHRQYLSDFEACTRRSAQCFESRDWAAAARNADRRVALYRSAVNGTWGYLRSRFGEAALENREDWAEARHVFLAGVRDRYDADLALTFFYSIMRIALVRLDPPVEYGDDGLSERAPVGDPVWRTYDATPERLSSSIAQVLQDCGFHARWRDLAGDAVLVSARCLAEWRTQASVPKPRDIQVLKPVFFRDREAYVVGKLRCGGSELPVVMALKNEEHGIFVDAVLTGREDMRNILFVSTRSTFHVHTSQYREVLNFLDTLAPERGHPAMCAVLGFTHPARVGLNQALRRHLHDTGERLAPAPGRIGMAMIVFSPPSFPYVLKVVRDHSPKIGWTGRERIIQLYRWVHEMNRGRLMLDAWLYRNLQFPRSSFEPKVIRDLLDSAPSSVRIDDEKVVLKHVYAQRRVLPMNNFFDGTSDRGQREKAADALGCFIKDLAAMGFFVGDHYGLPFNTGLTHGMNVTLFDFDDLGPVLQYQFRRTPPLPDEETELLWNTDADGAWFAVDENDVLVDEWERYLGIPPDLQDFFRKQHGDLFTTEYWQQTQARVRSGELHYIQPYPPERRLLSVPSAMRGAS